MATSLVITLNGADSKVKGLADARLVAGDNKSVSALVNLIKGVAHGSIIGSLEVRTASEASASASGTVTVASIQADDTVTIGKTTLTGKSSPSGQSQFDSDGSDSVVAAAIASCINAHSTLSKYVEAEAAAAVVHVTVKQPGVIGNALAFTSSNGGRLAVSVFADGYGGAQSDAKTWRQ